MNNTTHEFTNEQDKILMKDRYYKLILFNGGVFFALGCIFASGMRTGGLGHFLATLFFLILSTSLFIISPNFKDPPPTWDEIRQEMAGFYRRMLS